MINKMNKINVFISKYRSAIIAAVLFMHGATYAYEPIQNECTIDGLIVYKEHDVLSKLPKDIRPITKRSSPWLGSVLGCGNEFYNVVQVE